MMKFSKRLSIIFTVILFIVTMFSGILNAYADTTKYSDIYFDYQHREGHNINLLPLLKITNGLRINMLPVSLKRVLI